MNEHTVPAGARPATSTDITGDDPGTSFRRIVEAAPVGMHLYSLEPDGRLVLCGANPAADRILHVRHSELEGRTIEEAFPSLAGTEIPDRYRDVALTGTPWSRDVTDYRDAKTRGAFEISAFQTAPSCMAVMFVDVTARMESEEALREKTAELDRFFSSTLDLLCIADLDGCFRRLNPEWERTLGYKTEELIGRRFLDFVHPDDLEPTLAAVGQLADQQAVLNFVNRYRCHDGSFRWIEWRSFPAGRLIYAAARDITERRAMEEERARLHEQLQQAMKMEAIGRLAGGVAHDFNNLLTSILGYVELALADLEPDHPVSPMLREVSRAGESAASLTRQLLAFSRKQIIEPRVLDLNELIARLRKMLVRLLGEHIGLETRLHPGLGAVRVDPGQFEQVIVNMAVNARDAMPGGGRLVIATANVDRASRAPGEDAGTPGGPAVSLTVEDTGHGMPPEVLAHLFEPFFTTKPKDKGTGLGLATIYGIVRQAGGTIDVRSNVGEGTAFTIVLPTVQNEVDSWHEHGRVDDLPRGHQTILLVEDEASVRELALRILDRLGYRVLVAANGADALSLASGFGERIDLLLTDVVMPGMSGRGLATALARSHPESAVLFTSGYTDDMIGQHGVLEPGLRFLGKPYTPQVLAHAVHEALER
jgi:two-component system, cell cycle sensor histidine kinase and response regulator CckA